MAVFASCTATEVSVPRGTYPSGVRSMTSSSGVSVNLESARSTRSVGRALPSGRRTATWMSTPPTKAEDPRPDSPTSPPPLRSCRMATTARLAAAARWSGCSARSASPALFSLSPPRPANWDTVSTTKTSAPTSRHLATAASTTTAKGMPGTSCQCRTCRSFAPVKPPRFRTSTNVEGRLPSARPRERGGSAAREKDGRTGWPRSGGPGTYSCRRPWPCRQSP